MGAGGVEQPESADDIGFDESGRPIDRTVDMALGGEMHDDVDGVIAQQGQHRRVVADVGLHEAIVWIVLDLPQRGEVAGIGQLVDIDDVVAGVGTQMPAHRRADEPGAAGNQDIRQLKLSELTASLENLGVS